ncbi:sulfatase-like hydrolase/transferase [Iamia majanohamensis]|uniref:Sulfatase-like hydrolase/transferase n=2 Tax=Iamia majanohamensis TaxID=467976 RepID=A0AAF0BW11_9ACTN|nr:sulfatase-like hydrolase/transferase [Iamia majanohamensis]WCO66909.1 sulfatase-like hydrolase/transferase [Iamia majanohamensis]
MTDRPDVIIVMTDEERAIPPYETDEVRAWRDATLTGRRWFDENGVRFDRHYTGSLACVPSRPTIFTGQYPDVHGVTQTDGLGKLADDSRMRWLREGEVPTLGSWFRAGGYDTHYDGKWHISHADLVDPETGRPLATNDRDGNVIPDAVQAYLDADPLDPFGFSGWVGPEPHGAPLANAGLRRDPLIADRICAWLEDRYRRRREGDVEALRPFLLVASFVNPHDIVLFPAWQRKSPISPSPLDPPHVPPAPTADEDLSDKPAAQVAYRASYPTAYGPAPFIERLYANGAQEYRDLYLRLHAEVDTPIDRVRRAVTEGGSESAVLVRTSDHGDLLGAHGGLHQKWFNLYDEATRVPFTVVRTGPDATRSRVVDDMPTSHVDIIPTLLAAAGIDQAEVGARLAEDFTEVHPLPGRDLMPVVDGTTTPDRERSVYLITRDNVLEGDSTASAIARRLGRDAPPPLPLRIRVPAHVASSFEGLVARIEDGDALGGAGHLWKVVRTFDDPSTWTEPGVRHLASDGPGGPTYRTAPLDDQWELYDLTGDPCEAANRWTDPDLGAVRDHVVGLLKAERARAVPERHQPWPYADRHPVVAPAQSPPPPARALRRLAQRLGLHPADPDADPGISLVMRRALIVCTNHAWLDIGKPTGLFASEMTVPYYLFTDAGMSVDIASPEGGLVPVDPLSLKPVVRTEADDRFLADDDLRDKVNQSWPVAALDVADYDIVYLAGGWGAAFDLGTSEDLAHQVTRANELGKVIGGVCHGPLGLVGAEGADGEPLVKGRRISAVTDKQVHELGIDSTPQHPETELRRAGARFESETRFRDPLANHWVVDGNLVTGQNQNAAPMVAREMMRLVAEATPPPEP